jgi:hypothetical protein
MPPHWRLDRGADRVPPASPFRNDDGKSGSSFERVEIDGEPRAQDHARHDDWLARGLGDLACRQVTVWASGLLDLYPASLDHTVVETPGASGPAAGKRRC